MFPRKLRPGQKLTAAESSDLLRRTHDLDRGSGSGNLAVARDNGAFLIRDTSPETIHARITGAPSGSAYPWVEVCRNSTDTGWTDLSTDYGRSGTTTVTPARELTGSTAVPSSSIVELTPLPNGTGWGFTWGGAFALNTQNVDGTEVDAATADIRFDQSTHIKKQNLTGPARVRVYLDVTALAGDTDFINELVEGGALLTFTETVDVVTCVDFTAQTVTKRTLTMLTGTGIGDPVCHATETCCEAVDVACCENDLPQILTLTVSGGGGDYPATWDGTKWATGTITIPGCGTASLTLQCTGTDDTGFVVGNGTGVDCTFAVDLSGVVVTCDPFEAVAAGTFSGAGCSCGGKTLTWSIPA